MRLGPSEILILAFIILLLFGARRLPQLARSLREAREEFEKGKAGEESPSQESKD